MDALASAGVGEVQFPPAPPRSWQPRAWNESNQKQLRAALSGACKRMPHNAEAHFHVGLLHMRNADGEEALRAFQRAKRIFEDRERCYIDAHTPVPQRLTASIAKLRSHTAQAAHLAAATRLSREERAPLLDRLQKDLVASTSLDSTRPDVWNALALLHLSEGGYIGARDVFRSICQSFPDYLDAWNNLGLSELALGEEETAMACFQKVILCDRNHVESLSNYGVVLLRRGLYDAALRTFQNAVSGSTMYGFGLSFAWSGLAIAHVALGNYKDAEDAALEAERTADSVSRPRFSLLLLSIRARRISEELRRGEASDGRSATFIPLVSSLVASPVTDGKTKRSRASRHSLSSLAQTEDSISDSDGDIQRCIAPETENPAGGDCASAPQHDGMPVNAPDSSGLSRSASICKETDTVGSAEKVPVDPRPAIDSTVVRLRCIARELRSTSANTALGAVLRLRHDYLWDETGNRNFGAECAERLVDALEGDDSDASAWVQLALLQMGTGEYPSARDFAIQAVSRAGNLEAGWNALAVSYELNDESEDAMRAFEKTYLAIIANFSCGSQTSRRSQHEQVSCLETPNTGGDASRLRDTRNEELSIIRHGNNGENDMDAREDIISSCLDEPVVCPTSAGGFVDSDDDVEVLEKPVSLLSNELSPDVLRADLNRAGVAAMAAMYNNVGNLKRQDGKSTDDALAAYEKSLQLGGESAAVYNNLGLLYISMNRMDDAEKMLSYALTISPHFECAVSNLLKLRRLRELQRPSTTEVPGDSPIDS